MRQRWWEALSAAALSSFVTFSVGAQEAPEYRCARGDLQRRVLILYETGVAVPCEVHYFKDTEAPGERQVLWRALNQSGYCEAQAEAFVQRLEGWGWSCSPAAAPPPGGGGADEGDEPESGDDTENLAPAAPGAGD